MLPMRRTMVATLQKRRILLVLWSLLSVFLPLSSYSTASAEVDSVDEDCRVCRFLTQSFLEGLERTERLHFGGGNTDWEEQKLGSFRSSETRFVEAMEEYACKKEYGDLGSGSEKKSQFKCHSMAEEHEELLERWFHKEHKEEGNSDLEMFLCVDKLKKCCAEGLFGPECQACPGLKQSKKECFGRGTCKGSGTRRGDGHCKCHTGYIGKMCSNCDSTHFPVSQNSTYIECAECYTGCAGGCTADGPIGCRSCRSGWELDADRGCVDVNECEEELAEGEEGRCKNEHEHCVNTEGSFHCDCDPGYVRENGDEDGECKPDIKDTGTKEEDADSEAKSTTEEESGEEEQFDGKQSVPVEESKSGTGETQEGQRGEDEISPSHGRSIDEL